MGGAAAGRRRRPAGWTTWPPSRSAASSTAWSAWTRPAQVVRPALLWNDTRSAGAAADLVAELAAGRPAVLGRGGRQRAGGLLHRHQAALAGPARAGQRRPDGGGLPAARLADLAAGRRARPGRAAHRPGRRQRHRLLVAGDRRVPARPAGAGASAGAAALPRCSARPSAGRRRHAPAGAAARPGHRRQRRRRARRRRRPGRRGRLDRHLRHGVQRRRRPGRRPDRHGGRVRRRHRPLPAAGLHAERRPGARRRRRAARRRPRRAVRAGAVRPGRRGRAGPGALPGGRADPEPAATPPARCTACTLRTSTPAHLARAAVEGMLCALADGLDALVAQGAAVRPGDPGRRRGPLGGGAPDRRRQSSAARCWSRRPGEYVADGAARQAAWVALGGAAPPTWAARRAPRSTRPSRSPPSATGTPRPATWSSTGRLTRPDRHGGGVRVARVTGGAAGRDGGRAPGLAGPVMTGTVAMPGRRRRAAVDRHTGSTASWCSCCSPRWTTWRSAWCRRCTGRSPPRSTCRSGCSAWSPR